MKQLIINADDFGRHELINLAVHRAFRKGFLRSATIMAGGWAFDGAVRIAKNNPALGVGIHFTLANGNPVLDPAEIPTLVTAGGSLHKDYIAFLRLYVAGKISVDEIKAELIAQLEKVRRAGLNLTHFDSHQHLHHFPGIIDIVLDLAKAANIPAMRAANAGIFDGSLEGIGQLIGRLGLNFLAKRASRLAHKRNIATPNHFAGIVAGEAVDENFMAHLIKNLDDGTTEVMLHAGVNNILLREACQWNHDFEAELAAVTSPKLFEILNEKQIAAVNFGALR